MTVEIFGRRDVLAAVGGGSPSEPITPFLPRSRDKSGHVLPFPALLAVRLATGLAHRWGVEKGDGCHFWAVALEAAGKPFLHSLFSPLMDKSQDVAVTQLNHRSESKALEHGGTTA